MDKTIVNATTTATTGGTSPITNAGTRQHSGGSPSMVSPDAVSRRENRPTSVAAEMANLHGPETTYPQGQPGPTSITKYIPPIQWFGGQQAMSAHASAGGGAPGTVGGTTTRSTTTYTLDDAAITPLATRERKNPAGLGGINLSMVPVSSVLAGVQEQPPGQPTEVTPQTLSQDCGRTDNVQKEEATRKKRQRNQKEQQAMGSTYNKKKKVYGAGGGNGGKEQVSLNNMLFLDWQNPPPLARAGCGAAAGESIMTGKNKKEATKGGVEDSEEVLPPTPLGKMRGWERHLWRYYVKTGAVEETDHCFFCKTTILSCSTGQGGIHFYSNDKLLAVLDKFKKMNRPRSEIDQSLLGFVCVPCYGRKEGSKLGRGERSRRARTTKPPKKLMTDC
eukprot:scaffold13999_cov69-Cylindrotheca_fusiformis.AAC.2